MSILKKATERASDEELELVDQLANLFKKSTLSLQEKLVNPSIFMRRQELSMLIGTYEVFKLIQNIKGSIFYFGVYHGNGLMNFANLASALEPFNHSREIVGFDTFSGYDEISDKDKTHGKSFRTLVKGGFSSNSLEFLNELIKIYDKNRPLNHVPKIHLIKGDVRKTLPEYLTKNQHTVVSLMVLTLNLYEPTKIALTSLWPRIPKGGVVIIHSLNEDYYPGATKAIFESLGTVKINTFPFTPNMAYIIKE